MIKSALKKIYASVPFKRQAYTFLKIFWTPGENVYRHLHFKGVIRVPVENRSFRMMHYGYEVENAVFWGGLTQGWEKVSLNLWIKLCKEAEVIFDIGANTGIYALVAKALSPSSKVYAFEPVERVFKRLEENIALNKYDIVAVKKAASNFTGEAKFYDTPTDHIYSVTINKNLHHPDTAVIETRVETVTLDTFIEENKIEKMDLLKIDVETHEPEVMEGFAVHLRRFKPTILVEVLNNEVGERINKMVEGLDYIYYNINERGGIRKVDKITQSDYYNYLLCSREVAGRIGLE